MGFLGFGKSKRKVGLALGGGGARGFAHLGVIKALRENGVVFDCVAGVSAGAIAAAAYSVGMPFDEMQAAATNLHKRDILSSRLFFIPSDPKRVEETLHKLLGDERDDFKKCAIPLSLLAVDVVSAREYVFDSASSDVPISRAVSASCAVPGVFAPVKHEDMLLMDGGLMNNVPASVLRDAGCDAVLGVHVGNLTTPVAKGAGLADVLPAAIKILIRATSQKGVGQSDIVIIPDLEKQKFINFDNIEPIIEAGYNAAMARMPEIKELFK
jgi:NTE family protein